MKGLTLIELMIALIVMSVLMLFAIPAGRSLIRRNQTVSAVNQLLASYQFARSEAIARGASPSGFYA